MERVTVTAAVAGATPTPNTPHTQVLDPQLPRLTTRHCFGVALRPALTPALGGTHSAAVRSRPHKIKTSQEGPPRFQGLPPRPRAGPCIHTSGHTEPRTPS